MDVFMTVLWVVLVLAVYKMVTAERRWISYTGITVSLLMMVFLAMRVGYGLRECEIEPVNQHMELRVSIPTQLYNSVQSLPF